MIDLQKVIDGLFNNPKITNTRLVVCAFDNEAKMTINNPDGIFDDAIIATHSAAGNLDTIITKKIVDKDSRKGSRGDKLTNRAKVEVFIANKIGYARDKFGGKNDPRFIATFPEKMKRFYGKAAATFEHNVEALKAKVHEYVLVLGADFETQLGLLYDNYIHSEEDFDDHKNDVVSDIVNEQMASDVLSDQLTDNLLIVARNFRRSPTALKLYFDLDLLYPPKQKQIFRRKIAANTEMEICEIEYHASKHTKVIVKGVATLTFGMKLYGIKIGETLTLATGGKADVAFDFYYHNGTSFYVKNSSDNEGVFQFTITM